ncbi:hypothetical protein N0V82_000310 [Gnomoniopsis sp. IMI 355080]|nr:hypothetical protein N0V82_000310 [Gnomoniopsis sp. IMI 355080]
MVYCGKPSKGCSNCRERKIRCDQREPGCGQCDKRQQQCPGYRNLVDLMFRDESSHVIKKANAKARSRNSVQSLDGSASSPSKSARQPTTLTWSASETTPTPTQRRRQRGDSSSTSSTSPTTDSPSDSPPSEFISTFQLSPAPKAEHDITKYIKQEPRTPSILSAPASLPPPIPCSYSPSFEDRGLNLFITRYITVPPKSCQNKFDFVFDFWNPATSAADRANDPVLASLAAVGLLGIAQMTSGQTPLDAARKSYGQALRLTNAALRNPTEAVKDTTMLSVLVLSIFETMSGHSGRRSLAAWQQHIHGAAALARARGVAQFRSAAGVRMFMMQCSNTMISCIQNELPMPQDLIDLRGQLVDMLGGPSAVPGYEITAPIYKIMQLKHDIKQGIVTDMDEMLNTFNDAEDHFDTATSNFPEDWQYRTVRLTGRLRPGFFNHTCHIYPNIHVADIWNGLRTCRMLLLETLCEELNKRFSRVPVPLVPARYQLEYQKARYKLEKIALAILASAPHHFDIISPSDTLVPIPNTEEACQQIPDSGWDVFLGVSGSPESANFNDEEYDRHPSLSNPMQASTSEAQAERYMLLTSVTNGLVWPLYLVGVSSASSTQMKVFVVERLYAVYAESGLPQAKKLADAVANHSQAYNNATKCPKPLKLAKGGCNNHHAKQRQSQRPLVF